MAWVVLMLSGALEAVWAAALAAPGGLRRPGPALAFGLGLSGSLGGLAWAMQELPTGTAYAVWVGVGAGLTVLWGFRSGAERPTLTRVLLLMLLIGSVIGLKAVS